MLAVLGALVSGVLTTLAPCVLPLLPVIVGGSLVGGSRAPGMRRAALISASLGASVIAFTLLLKASTALIGVPTAAWSAFSGGLLIALGIIGLFPVVWEGISSRLRLAQHSSGALSRATGRDGAAGAVLTGAALGPVFSSCSPLYAYVVVTVLPAEPAYGVVLLSTYAIGLSGTLFAIALAGQRLVRRVGWAADSHGVFRRVLGLVFVVVGVFVLTGADRDLQAWIIENAPFAPWLLDQGFIPQ